MSGDVTHVRKAETRHHVRILMPEASLPWSVCFPTLNEIPDVSLPSLRVSPGLRRLTLT